MKVNFYLRRPKIVGKSAIYASICYDNNRLIVFPGESIHTDEWSDKKGKNEPKSSRKNAPLIGRLFQYEAQFREIFDVLKAKHTKVAPEIFWQAIREKLNPSLVVEKNAPVYIVDFFQTMINDCNSGKRLGLDGKMLTASTISTYGPTKTHFQNFQKKRKYQLIDINQTLIDGFSDYLNIELNMAANGSGKHMKNFRTMMNYARQKKLISSDMVSDNKVTVTKETPDNIYLTESELDDLMNLADFDSPVQEIVRDYFIIACKTALRFSDFSKLATARIDKEFIHIRQLKVNEKVTIPIHEMVAKILSKYPEGLPRCPPNAVFNKYLKEIGRKIPSLDTVFEKTLTRSRKSDSTTYKKWELLTTHTARRTFSTIEYLNGMPTITIMAITGHKTEKSFLGYIKADSLQQAMQARDFWNKKKENDKKVG